MTKKITLKHYEILSLIPGSRERSIKQKDLCRRTGLTPRVLKEYITDLRDDYPIVAQQTGRGGYWIAETQEEIEEFVKMISARRKGYQETEEAMKKYIYSQERISI